MSVITQKPNVRNVWASQGNTAPATIDKILEGWVAEIPENEVANWVEYRQDNAIKYLFQEGFAEWDGLFEYGNNSILKYNGVVYVANAYNVGKQPDLYPSIWSVAFDRYGASKAVQDIVDNILTDDGFLSLYVSKASPVMTGTAKAPSYEADAGMPTTNKGFNEVGYAFKNDDNSGLFKVPTSNGERVALVVDGIVGGYVPKGDQPVTINDETLITASYLKRYVDARLQASLVQVGMSVITNDPRDPATYLLYGTWELDCQGRSVVGLSKSVSNTIPEWVKTVNNIYGEYTHTLTESEIPSHKHSKNSVYNKFVAIASQAFSAGYGTGSGDGLTAASYDNGFMDNELHIGKISTNDQIAMAEAEVGGGQPHNNVQPSQVKYIYTRVG